MKMSLFNVHFVRMLGKLLEFTSIEYTIQDGGSPFKLAEYAQLIFFLPGRVKKSGYMKMSLFNVQLHFFMIYPLWPRVRLRNFST